MRKRYEYQNDLDFLKLIDTEHLQEQYAKITVLNWEEEPIQEIQGIVTGGTINIDGSSSVRRTCNISVYVDNDQYTGLTSIDNLISLNKKRGCIFFTSKGTSHFHSTSIALSSTFLM